MRDVDVEKEEGKYKRRRKRQKRVYLNDKTPVGLKRFRDIDV
jgi:hypothetical protein